jgi:hypothetical protein
MHALWLFFILLFSTSAAYAQPSDSDMLQRIKTKGVFSAKLSSGGGSVTKQVENGTWHWEYARGYTVKRSTEYEGVTVEQHGTLRYLKSGNSYSFLQKTHTWQEYHGIPNPTEEDVMRLAQADYSKALAPDYEKIVGELEFLGLAEDPQWDWLDINSVTVQVRAVYSRKAPQNTVEKVEKIYEWRLYRDDMKDPFNGFHSSSSGPPKILSSKQYSPMEFKRIRTLIDVGRKKKADARFATLPKLTMPDLNDLDATSQYLHELLKEADAMKIESFLLQALSSKWVLDKVPEHEFASFLEKTIDHAGRYKEQYCDRRINVKTKDQSISWYGRSRTWSLKVELDRVTEYEQPKIRKLYLVTHNTSDPAKLSAFDCAAQPDVYEPEAPHTPSYTEPTSPVKTGTRDNLAQGSAVLCKYAADGYWYPATITGVQGSMYQVKFMDGYATSVSAQEMVIRTLAVGHLAHVRTSGRGIIVTTITKIEGDTYTLKTDMGGSLTVKVSQLRFK